MTGNELKLETKREVPGSLSGRADFGVAGNKQTLTWLLSTIDHLLKNPGVEVISSTSLNDGSTLTVRIVGEGVSV